MEQTLMPLMSQVSVYINLKSAIDVNRCLFLFVVSAPAGSDTLALLFKQVN